MIIFQVWRSGRTVVNWNWTRKKLISISFPTRRQGVSFDVDILSFYIIYLIICIDDNVISEMNIFLRFSLSWAKYLEKKMCQDWSKQQENGGLGHWIEDFLFCHCWALFSQNLLKISSRSKFYKEVIKAIQRWWLM